MKIFSNFDTNAPLEAYKQALAEYGADKVMFFRRYKIYLIFFVVLPAVALLIGLIGAVLLWRALFANNSVSTGSIFGVVLIILVALIIIMVGITILLNYINYLLDYTIVTPHLITSWNQKGIFSREIKTLDTDKIKAITASASSFMQSLFNYGSIIFLSEGDEEDHGDIRLHYLHDVADLKDQVVLIVNMARDS